MKEAGHVLQELKLALAVQVRDKPLASAWHRGWDNTLQGGVFPLNNQMCQRSRGKEFLYNIIVGMKENMIFRNFLTEKG